MNLLDPLQSAVKALSSGDYDAFKRWLTDYEFERWTDQIERDSYDVNSPIMKMAEQALLEHKKGKTREL